MGYRFSQQTYSFFSRCCVHVWCVEKAFNLTWESWREIDYMYSDLCKLTQLLERCVYIGIQSTWLCTVINYKLLWGMFLLTLKLWDVEYVLHWGGGRSSLCFFFSVDNICIPSRPSVFMYHGADCRDRKIKKGKACTARLPDATAGRV